MNESFVLTEENGILTLTMGAEGNNLMTAAFLEGFENIMAEVEKRAAQGGLKGMIICGSGRHFSVGADVPSLVQRTSESKGYISSKEERNGTGFFAG